jgi:hypothetical protein
MVIVLSRLIVPTGAGTRCGQGAGSDIRTSGSTKTRCRDIAIWRHCHTVTL